MVDLIFTESSCLISPLLLQADVVDKPYPWYAGMAACLLVFSSVLCIPTVAILRKFGFLYFDAAKAAQADTHGHTSSTAAFMSRGSDDTDSGHNSDDINEGEVPFVDRNIEDTSCAVGDSLQPTFTLETEGDEINNESRI